jgi:hypothetical protein
MLIKSKQSKNKKSHLHPADVKYMQYLFAYLHTTFELTKSPTKNIIMETTVSPTTAAAPSKSSLLAGRIISVICILFLLFDAIAKIMRESHSVKGTIFLGYGENMVQVIGTILLVCTIIYIIPRTAVLGAILITGYLGGAVAIMMRANQPAYFPIVFGILVWLSLYLRDGKVKSLLNFGGKW